MVMEETVLILGRCTLAAPCLKKSLCIFRHVKKHFRKGEATDVVKCKQLENLGEGMQKFFVLPLHLLPGLKLFQNC